MCLHLSIRSHPGLNLTAESNKGQLDAYIKSAEWDLEGRMTAPHTDKAVHETHHLDFSGKSDALKYDCCPDLYPFVLYTIRIRRRSLYYFTNIVRKAMRWNHRCWHLSFVRYV